MKPVYTPPQLFKFSIQSIFIVLMLSFCLSFPFSVYAKSYPVLKDKYVNDYANLLTESSRQQLRIELSKQHTKTKRYITVLIINKLSPYGRSLTIESFATGLFNKWAIGNAVTNNAVLILISKQDRKMRIELGKSYGTAYDAPMKSVIDSVIVPHFKQKLFHSGILLGITRINDGLSGPVTSIPTVGQESQGLGSFMQGILLWFYNLFQSIPWWAYTIFGIYSFFKIRNYILRYLRNRPRSCKTCKLKMKRLSEKAEDLHLSEGNLLEEAIDSIDYDVWSCTPCSYILIKRYPLRYSGYGACPECSFHTFDSDYHVIESATEYSTGREQIDYRCVKCDFKKTEYGVIPRKDPPSSDNSAWSNSSSGMGGSYDSGGSSSGGGASGSW